MRSLLPQEPPESLDVLVIVSDIASLVGLSKSAVSHQLAYMRINKLVRVKREGRKVFYALNDSHVESVFALALSHIKE